jgi:hypothetical protein
MVDRHTSTMCQAHLIGGHITVSVGVLAGDATRSGENPAAARSKSVVNPHI